MKFENVNLLHLTQRLGGAWVGGMVQRQTGNIGEFVQVMLEGRWLKSCP